MAEYLNLSGLQTLWTKAKNTFVPKTRKINDKELSSDVNLVLGDIVPIASKTFSNVIGSAADQANANFYFGKLTPADKSLYVQCRIRYRLYAWIHDASQIPSTDTNKGNNVYTRGWFDVELNMRGESLIVYYVWNNHSSTSYKTITYHEIGRAKNATIQSGGGHILGVRTRDAYSPIATGWNRDYKIDILELENCTFEFFGEMKKHSVAYTSDYVALSEVDGTNNGLRESGDDNDTSTIYSANTGYVVGANGMKQYSLCAIDKDGMLQSFTKTSGTGTTKTVNDAKFKFPLILYRYNQGTDRANGYFFKDNWIQKIVASFDSRYSCNRGTVFNSNAGPVYIEGTIGDDGYFTVSSNILTQTFTKGKVYVHVGNPYNAGAAATNTYNLNLDSTHPAYFYDGTNLVPFEDGRFVHLSGDETIAGEKNFSYWRTSFTSGGSSAKRIVVGNDFRKFFLGISAKNDDGSGGNLLFSELAGTENLSGDDKAIIYTSNRSTDYQFNGNAKTATSASTATSADHATEADSANTATSAKSLLFGNSHGYLNTYYFNDIPSLLATNGIEAESDLSLFSLTGVYTGYKIKGFTWAYTNNGIFYNKDGESIDKSQQWDSAYDSRTLLVYNSRTKTEYEGQLKIQIDEHDPTLDNAAEAVVGDSTDAKTKLLIPRNPVSQTSSDLVFVYTNSVARWVVQSDYFIPYNATINGKSIRNSPTLSYSDVGAAPISLQGRVDTIDSSVDSLYDTFFELAGKTWNLSCGKRFFNTGSNGITKDHWRSIMRITIDKPYSNGTIRIPYYNRNSCGELYLKFSNASTTSGATITYFRVRSLDGNNAGTDFYIRKTSSSSSTWMISYKAYQSSDRCTIDANNIFSQQNQADQDKAFTIEEYNSVDETSLPSGLEGTQASLL